MNNAMNQTKPEWKKTACILCSVNCGIEVQTESGRITKIRGDDEHPVSKGYLCEKSQRMDYYQNGADRLDSPMRRTHDGRYEAISWDTAITEIAAKFQAIKTKYGGESILYYGGGGQGNHLGGAYADSFLKALGNKYRSNALAQEKTGEFWVQGKMFATGSHGDFEHCEVAVFIGKNPWQSHGFARSRVILREIQKDPQRKLIVIDPRKSETAEMADYHLAIKPGTDAWCLAALVAIIVQDGLLAKDWLREHSQGVAEIEAAFNTVPVARYAEICGVELATLRAVAQCMDKAKSVSVMEDLGLQMNRHSTLNSYLQRLTWVLTGHYGRQGTSNSFTPFLSLAKASKGESGAASKKYQRVERRSPVANAKIIIGLIPCNVIPEEILTDHPKRYRALLVQSGNPVHSLADSQRMRQAMRTLELSVVVDVAMTETARQADYVLPASSQFEKAEATFFNMEFPRNAFHLRHPLFPPREGTLAEAEIYTRLVEAMGEIGEADYAPLRRALRLGKSAFAVAFALKVASKPKKMQYAPLILYRVLGPTLPKGMEPAAVLWGVTQFYVQANRQAAKRAGFGGISLFAGEKLFRALLDGESGVVFADGEYADSWKAIKHPDYRIQLPIPELLEELKKLEREAPTADRDFPFILSAGERRSDTSNTAVRNSGWHKKGSYGTLRIHPADAARLTCNEGDTLRLTTRRGTVNVPIEITAMMQPGHISLPNGQGLDYATADGRMERKGVAPNELTDASQRDFLAGTPWHKHVPARLEKVATL